MEFVLIKVDSDLWNGLWDELATHPINEGIENPSTATHEGNSWEYRGSFKQGNIIISDFLHRKHPTTNEIYRLSIRRENIKAGDLFKSIRL